MKVLKFGGTSVQNSENISKVIDIVKNKLKEGKLAVTVSALGGITNLLIKVSNKAAAGDISYKKIFEEIRKRHIDTLNGLIPEEEQLNGILDDVEIMLNELREILRGIFLIRELSPRTLDLTQSFGERLSANIIADAFVYKGIKAEFLDSRMVIKTDNNFTKANVDFKRTNKNIVEYFNNHSKLQIIPGFISGTEDEETTTLGRGGSDYTAAIFAAALKASALEIWTDVDGMLTADPRVVRKAFLIDTISYDEALELSHFGSKVVHPRTIAPVLTEKTPIWIKNTFNPSCRGTLICEETGDKTSMIRGISSIDNVCLITIQGPGLAGVVGMAGRIFQAISKESINILLITQGSSEHSVTFAVLPEDAAMAKGLIEREFELEFDAKLLEPLVVEENLCIVAIVGENMKNRAGISARLFEAVGRNGVSVIATAQGASELNISIVIDAKNKRKALNSIHEAFFLSDTQTINAFVIGTGTIGGTLLNQIAKQKDHLAKNNMLELRVVGLGNADNMLFDLDGIDTTKWQEELDKRGEKMDVDSYIKNMKELNLRNSVFVDNTASYNLPEHYEDFLNSNISVVTPNKVANSSEYENYERIHKAAMRYGVQFNYETNVGAGLPIINTLQSLIASGDKIIKIEAILSGSLNFIFSALDNNISFYDAVEQAKQKGYTEPDPRLDLNGMDVARKILILSREAGLKINIEDLNVEACISDKTLKAKSMDEFWVSLQEIDNKEFAQKYENARKKKMRLKYIATFENGKASTAIKEVDEKHPFYSISGSDNIVSFTTERYKTNPLIVIGPGAGAEVTAGGVFADIIKIVKQL